MTYEISKGDDGILRWIGTGDLDEGALETIVNELTSYLESATETDPLLLLSDVSRSGKISARARSALAGLSGDPRVEKNAILGSGRYQRVLATFIDRAVGRDNIRFFDTEEQALAWLKSDGSHDSSYTRR